MNTMKSKPLAKVLGPVLLLSAALSLPVDSFAAPSPKERNAQADQADRNEKKANRAERQKRNQKQEVRQERQRQQVQSNRGEERRAEAQRKAELNRQRAAERQAAAQRKADLNRQRAAERQAAAQRAEARQAQLQRKAESQRLKQQNEQNRRERMLRESRQADINRQAEINRRAQLQRQAELNRQAQLQRQAELNRRANAQRFAVPRNNRSYDRWFDRSGNRYRSYAGGRSWSRGDTIAVDGHLTDEGYSCQALRDDNGDLYMLVGNTYGLRMGDHARVIGRVVDGGYCDWEGIAFEITDVTALWADRRHQAVYYHQNYDGGRFGHRDEWFGRNPRQFFNRIER